MLILLTALVGAAQAATVTNINDSGAGSPRQAIAAAASGTFQQAMLTPIIIDDFSTGAFSISHNQTVNDLPASGAIGGSRDATVQETQIHNNLYGYLRLDLGTDYLFVQNGAFGGNYNVAWGNNSLLGGSDLNLNASGYDRLVVTISSAPIAGTLTVRFNNTGSPSASLPITGPGDYAFLFSSSSLGSLNTADIDGITLTFSNATSRVESVTITAPPDPDTDGDGVPDSSDNCPTTPNPEKIAFSSNRDGNTEIYVMSTDGMNQTRLTNTAFDSDPSFSGNGSRIAFRSTRDGNSEIYVMDADGSNQINRTNNPGNDDQPSFSPDGSKIAFVSSRAGNSEIYVMNSDGSNQINLTNNAANDFAPSFSPDGTKILFNSARDGINEIYVMNANGSNQARLTNNSVYDDNPSFSPDGTRIAFNSLRGNNYDIYVINSDGTNETRLTNHSAVDQDPTFSPDGSKITFLSNRDGNNEIYVMDADGTNQTRRTNNSASDAAPSWGAQADSDNDGTGDACEVFDTTPPVITPTVTGAPGNNGWYTSDVQVSWSVTDAESSVSNQTGCDQQTVTSDTGGVTFTCDATSPGGMSSQSVTVKRDATAPTISAAATTSPNGALWYKTDVTVQFTCMDSMSGISSGACPANQTLTTESPGVSSTSQTVTDDAGNTSSPSNVVTVKIDKTPPTLNPVVLPSPVQVNGSATATSGAADSLSGLASQSCDALDTSTAGLRSVTCYATDNAGNSTSATANYTVQSGFNFTGFFAPVDNLPMVNIVNAGQAIPLKFSLGGYQGLDIFAAGYPASSPIVCDASEPGSTVDETVNAGGSSLTYDAATDRYTYVWKTNKAWKGACRILIVRLSDGSDHFAKFRFK